MKNQASHSQCLELPVRSKISPEDAWNVEALFPDLSAWRTAVSELLPAQGTPQWEQLDAFKGRLGENPETLKAALDLYFDLSRKLTILYTYAHLRHDEEITHDAHKTAYDQILAAMHDFSHATSWFEPELLALDDQHLQAMLASPVLAPYKFHIEKAVRIKKHLLSPQEEALLALSGKALQATHKAFSAINDADFKFGTALDSRGNELELTHGSYGLFIREKDRTLRQNAFLKLHKKYLDYEHTLCELLNGQIQAHLFNAKARRYTSCLEAALFPKNIDTEVYRALIEAVNAQLPTLHAYISLREQVMDVGPLHLYDMYVPLVSSVDMRFSYKEAEELVIESAAPLGAAYQNMLRKGLQQQRWVDRFENRNKRSGAYSSGCYDSMPYILMNYKEQIKDLFTLAHEAGHSMHSLLSHTEQPYHYSDYPIFLAEVASTFNEELLMRLMLERAQTREERIYLINEKLEDIRGTLFRQTMFAEFELLMHEMAEKNIPLTPKLLREEYRKLNARFFGERVLIDEEAELEWARIPHFYYNFYVFQYATGISAALALADRVVNGGTAEREAYLSFLKGGSSRYPIELLQLAGVDMRTPQPVMSAIGKFSALVQQLENELAPAQRTQPEGLIS
jgi:oligoendopeptidase F